MFRFLKSRLPKSRPRLTGDALNPIFVRETRKMVRSRLVVLALNLYLLALLAYLGVALYRYFEQGCPENYGYKIFHGIVYLAGLATFVAAVGQTALGVAFDRIHDDLLFSSSLTPGRNIRGRLACCFFTSLMFYSVSAPFLSIAYLFRGIDLWMFAYYLPLHFLGIQIAALMAIAVFSAVRSWPQFIFYALLFAALVLGVGYLLLASLDIIRLANYGMTVPGTRTFHHVNWEQVRFGCAVLLTTIFFTTITSYLFARCNFSPVSTNRMAPLRRWLSLFFILTLIASGILASLPGGRYYFYHIPWPLLWTSLVVAILSAMLILTVCERETWEGRLRRSIPKRFWRRLLAFPFFTGSVNGLFWVFLWTFALLVGASLYTLQLLFPSWNGGDQETLVSLTFVFRLLIFLTMIFNYSMTAFFLWKILLRRWVPREMIWTLTLGLLVAVSMGTSLLALPPGTIPDIDQSLGGSPLLAPNPFVILIDENYNMFQVVFAVAWFGLIMLFAYPWLKSRFLDFTPKEPGT